MILRVIRSFEGLGKGGYTHWQIPKQLRKQLFMDK